MVRFAFLLAMFAVGSSVAAETCPAEFYEGGGYRIFWSCSNGEGTLENGQGKTLSRLTHACFYEKNGLKKARLVSKLGFSLENIPLEGENNSRFFRECMEMFLRMEKGLPLVRKNLLAKGYNARDISTLKFCFPDNPEIGKKSGLTLFHDSRFGLVRGVTDRIGSETATITHSEYRGDYTPFHEYIHMSGYGIEYHDHEVFKYSKVSSDPD